MKNLEDIDIFETLEYIKRTAPKYAKAKADRIYLENYRDWETTWNFIKVQSVKYKLQSYEVNPNIPSTINCHRCVQ